MNLKSIFHGFNLRGNKIINAIFNTPTVDGHAANKKYVDDSLILDTATALELKNSTTFPWVTAVDNNSIKPLLDKLLFAVVNPIYVNPKFQDIKIIILSEFLSKGDKYLLFQDVPKTFRVEYNIIASDRLSNVVAKVVVTKNDNSTQIFNSLTTSDVSGTVVFSFDFSNIKSIKLTKQFNPVTVIKNDSSGNPMITPEFEQNYLLEYDLLADLTKQNIIVPPMLLKNINEETEYLTDLVANANVMTLPLYQRGRSFIINGSDNLSVLLIPKIIFDPSKIIIHINGIATVIDKNLLNPGVTKEIILMHQGISVTYSIATLDFGSYSSPTNIDFQFEIIN